MPHYLYAIIVLIGFGLHASSPTWAAEPPHENETTEALTQQLELFNEDRFCNLSFEDSPKHQRLLCVTECYTESLNYQEASIDQNWTDCINICDAEVADLRLNIEKHCTE
ncbi:MAG: hypothetical protein V7785_25085 [Bermanella sp.]